MSKSESEQVDDACNALCSGEYEKASKIVSALASGLDDVLSALLERAEHCHEMELQCYRAGEPDIAKNWAIKLSEVAKAVETVKRYLPSQSLETEQASE